MITRPTTAMREILHISLRWISGAPWSRRRCHCPCFSLHSCFFFPGLCNSPRLVPSQLHLPPLLLHFLLRDRREQVFLLPEHGAAAAAAREANAPEAAQVIAPTLSGGVLRVVLSTPAHAVISVGVLPLFLPPQLISHHLLVRLFDVGDQARCLVVHVSETVPRARETSLIPFQRRHHHNKLVEVDLARPIGIDLADQRVKTRVSDPLAHGRQDHAQLLPVDRPRAVQVHLRKLLLELDDVGGGEALHQDIAQVVADEELDLVGHLPLSCTCGAVIIVGFADDGMDMLAPRAHFFSCRVLEALHFLLADARPATVVPLPLPPARHLRAAADNLHPLLLEPQQHLHKLLVVQLS
mmetsp:Transcript_10139/g.23786  ORF Transcript_10139/g.23786 Transcript_10139/m.23786 type:complete len:353 (+) Transcript_10139:71-1129(+)